MAGFLIECWNYTFAERQLRAGQALNRAKKATKIAKRFFFALFSANPAIKDFPPSGKRIPSRVQLDAASS